MSTLTLKATKFGRQQEMKAIKARLIRNAELHLEAKGQEVEELDHSPIYDNCLRGQMLVGTALDRQRISTKLAIAYWKYGKELRHDLFQKDEIYGTDRWMAPKFVDMIAKDGNVQLLSTMSQRGLGIDLHGMHESLCSSVSSHYLDQYYISSRADYGSSLGLTHDTYGWISSSSVPQCEFPQIEGPTKELLRLECKDEPVAGDEPAEGSIWRYDSGSNESNDSAAAY